MNYYFITGTSTGIGRALVEELVAYPRNRVIGWSRSNFFTHEQFEHRFLDLSKQEALFDVEFDTFSDAKRIVLINNAGCLGEIAYIGQQQLQNLLDVHQVNFTSAAALMNKFIKTYQHYAIEKTIINISSGAASSPYDGWANYCSAKAALNMFTEVLHLEQQKVDNPCGVYAIAPGVVDTYMQESIREISSDKFSKKEKFVELKANGALYAAKDVAKKLVQQIENPATIPSVISRISL
ncbi:MAG: SDR family NAD(P)-dependent oxidoreductase [Chitinophagales bacterium]